MESTQLCAPKSAQDLLLEFRVTGRQQPFEEIVRRYAGMVYHVCLQVTKDAHDAEDATQAVFLTLAVQAKTANPIRSIGPWLQQVAKRLSLDLRKSRKRRQKREERHGMMARQNHNGNGWDGATPLQAAELKAVLTEELQNLPAKYRLPLILHYFGGMNREAMAAELNCKPGTLGARLHRGRAMLGLRLAERGVTLKDGILAGALAFSVHHAVTESLVASTSEAAIHLAAGRELGVGLVSANVVGMVRRAVHMALYAKVKMAGIGVLLAGTMLAAGTEVLARTTPVDLRLRLQLDLGGRIWPLLQPLFRPMFTDALPATEGGSVPAYASAAPAPVGAPAVVSPHRTWPELDWNADSMSRPQWSGALVSELGGGLTPHLFPDRPTPEGGQVALQAALPREASVVAVGPREVGAVLPPVLVQPMVEAPVPAGVVGAGRVTPMVISASTGAVAAAPPPMVQVVSPPVPNRVPELRPLEAATGEAVGGIVAVDAVAGRVDSGDLLVRGILPPASPLNAPDPPPVKLSPVDEWISRVQLAGVESARDVVLLPSSGAPAPADGQSGSGGDSSIRVGQSGAPDTSTSTAVQFADARQFTGQTSTINYAGDAKGQPLDAASSGGTGTPYHSTTSVGQGGDSSAVSPSGQPVPKELVAVPGIRLRGVRVGPPTQMLRGWGIVEDTNVFDQSGQVIADGLGSPRTLDLSQVKQIVNTMPNPAGGGANGWFARDGGKLVLPPISVVGGSGSYNWGDSAYDPRIDLINSVRVGFDYVSSPGLLHISLLALDRPDVPRLPTGHHFVGLWEFDGVGLAYDRVQLTVRYDNSLVANLGLDEAYLKLWRYDGQKWQIVQDGFTLDRFQKLISGRTDHLSYFAVSTPEPGGMMVVGLATWFLCRRRRRN